MEKRLQVTRLAGAALLALATLEMSAVDAFAAKEKFVRNKPHVNVGTPSEIGPGSMTATPSTQGQPPADCEPDPAKVGETSRPPCGSVEAN